MAPGTARYDRIGVGYATRRRADPRIARAIEGALGDAREVLDVGSGAGSYEPRGRDVLAVEPSAVMVAQRPATAAPVVRAVAEHLPFPDASFDAVTAILTHHHWTDVDRGLGELVRVAPRQVVLTWDPAVSNRFWFVAEYLPEVEVAEAAMAPLAVLQAHLAIRSIDPVPVPADCTDAFLGAHWRRPSAYLDPGVRAAASAFATVEDAAPGAVDRAVAHLAADLRTGAWHARHGELLDHASHDVGLRLVVAEGRRR